MEPSLKLSRLEYGSHWANVAPEDRQKAETVALENWDRPDLLEFSKELRQITVRKHMITKDFGYPYARMSMETGIVLSTGTICDLAQTSNGLYEFLFERSEYSRYVVRCAEAIALGKTDLTIPALIVANRILRSHRLGSVCNALLHTRPIQEPVRCAELIEEVHPRVLHYLDTLELRLVSKRTAATIGRELRMRVTIDGVPCRLLLSTTLQDVKLALDCQSVRRYGRTGPMVPNGRIAQMKPAHLYTE